MSSWFSAAAETPDEASPAAALDEAALLLKSFTREEAELGARAPLPRLDGYVFVLFIAAQLAQGWQVVEAQEERGRGAERRPEQQHGATRAR